MYRTEAGGRRQVYKWDPSFFMQRPDILQSANSAAMAQPPGSLISALETFC